MRRFVTPCGHNVTLVEPRSHCDHRVSQSVASHIIDHTIAVSYITMYTTFITHHMLTSHITQCHSVTPRCLPVPRQVPPSNTQVPPGASPSATRCHPSVSHDYVTILSHHPHPIPPPNVLSRQLPTDSAHRGTSQGRKLGFQHDSPECLPFLIVPSLAASGYSTTSNLQSLCSHSYTAFPSLLPPYIAGHHRSS